MCKIVVIFKSLTKNDLSLIIKIQKELFPEHSAKINYEESLVGKTDNEYFLIYVANECIGILGIYHYPSDYENAWLDWFGILKQYRRKGHGSKIIRHFESIAKERGFKFAHLYTDKYINDAAISFYKSLGYVSEDYKNDSDPAYKDYHILIFSKPLDSYSLKLWNNRSIHLIEQVKLCSTKS